MIEAVRRLSMALARSEGNEQARPLQQLRAEAREFFDALSVNARQNADSAHGHRKFQCKINYSLPIHRDRATNQILVPGTPDYAARDARQVKTQQHTLGVELRISDRQSWHASELKGESHHDAYRFRQLLALMNRLFRPSFDFPRERAATPGSGLRRSGSGPRKQRKGCANPRLQVRPASRNNDEEPVLLEPSQRLGRRWGEVREFTSRTRGGQRPLKNLQDGSIYGRVETSSYPRIAVLESEQRVAGRAPCLD
jgi:hypothetical protein